MGQLNTPGLPPHSAWLADPYQSAIDARKGLQFLFLAVIHDQEFKENWTRTCPEIPLFILREDLANIYQANAKYTQAPQGRRKPVLPAVNTFFECTRPLLGFALVAKCQVMVHANSGGALVYDGRSPDSITYYEPPREFTLQNNDRKTFHIVHTKTNDVDHYNLMIHRKFVHPSDLNFLRSFQPVPDNPAPPEKRRASKRRRPQ